MEQEYQQYVWPQWWLRTMIYLRELPGTMYKDQLIKHIGQEQRAQGLVPEPVTDPVEYMNSPQRLLKGTCEGAAPFPFIKCDETTGGIYTIPYMRKLLDAALHAYNPAYIYNRFLYMNSLAEQPERECTFHQLQAEPALFDRVFRLNRTTGELTVDLQPLPEGLWLRDFQLQELVDYFRGQLPPGISLSFGAVHGENRVFSGNTQLVFEEDFYSAPSFQKGACFNGATFTGPLEVRNVTFLFGDRWDLDQDGYAVNRVDFRNARFFTSASFRDVRFIGDILDLEISFEDARFSQSLEFNNVDFGHTKLNCFQTVIGAYNQPISQPVQYRTDGVFPHRLSLVNVHFADDSAIECSDMEMHHGQVILRNIDTLPPAHLCFAPLTRLDSGGSVCPDNYLLLQNCELQQTVTVCNVSQLSFWDCRNFGRIMAGSGWAPCESQRGWRTRTRGLGGTYINNRLLLAVYNNRQTALFQENRENMLRLAKARDFIMLKENFSSQGLYEDEDTAFILYMEFKPVLDSLLQGKEPERLRPRLGHALLYQCLYATGKYGISPGRVILALLLTVLLFAVPYSIAARLLGPSAFSLGGTLGNQWNYAEAYLDASLQAGSLLDTLVVALVYSLEGVIPFVSQFEPISLSVCILTACENFVGTFLTGYFSVAVVRKTLR